jgi:hypothetical protein
MKGEHKRDDKRDYKIEILEKVCPKNGYTKLLITIKK